MLFYIWVFILLYTIVARGDYITLRGKGAGLPVAICNRKRFGIKGNGWVGSFLCL